MAYQYRARGLRGAGIDGIGEPSGHNEPEVFMISSSGNCGWCEFDDGLVNVGRIDFGAETVLFEDEDIEQIVEYLKRENAERIVVEEQNAIIKSYDMERIDRGTYQDLSGVYFDNCSFHADYNNASFEGSIINRTCSMQDAEFINCTFRNAKLQAEEIVNTRFTHNNFNNAQLSNVRMKDCILDTNNFEEAHFYNVGLNGTVVKDNSFLLTTIQNSYLHHIEAYGINRYADTIRFHFGGATREEFEKARDDFIRQLATEPPENISDVPLRDIDWNKVEEIYAYETKHNIPSDKRVTEWFGDYGMAVPKHGVSIMKFEHRYEDAKYDSPWNEKEDAMERAIEDALNNNVAEELVPEIMNG